MKTHWQIERIDISYAQRSIIISALLSIPTKRQSTNEDVFIEEWHSGSRNILVSLFRFWKHCRKTVKELQEHDALMGYDLSPSNFTLGITKPFKLH